LTSLIDAERAVCSTKCSVVMKVIILFDDTGMLLPDGRAVPPHLLTHIQRLAAA